MQIRHHILVGFHYAHLVVAGPIVRIFKSDNEIHGVANECSIGG